MKDAFSVFVTFKDNLEDPAPDNSPQTPLLGSTYCGYHTEQTVPQQTISSAGDTSILTIPDPRLPSLGYRIILPSSCAPPLPPSPTLATPPFTSTTDTGLAWLKGPRTS